MPAMMPLGWEGLCLLVAAISLSIIALLHMLSVSFGLTNVTLWAKSEYAQVAVTVLIVILAVGLRDAGANIVAHVTGAVARASGNIVLADQATPTPSPGTSAPVPRDPSEIGKAYLLQGPIKCEENLYLFVFNKNIGQELFSTVSFNVGNVEGISTGFLYYGIVSRSHYIAQNVTYLALFHYVQYSVLQFAKYTMLQIFLPIGIILRAFPMTRGAGGLITAFALGFAFVFPMTYVLIVAMMPSTDYACTQVKLLAETEAAKPQPCASNAGDIVQIIYEKKTDTQTEKQYTDILHAFGMIYMQAVFYPMFTLIITFTFIRQTGSLFGADLAEIGRGLIKLI